MFINRVKHNYLSSEFAKLAQKVKDEGLSDEDIEKVYMYLSSATSEAQYENISDCTIGGHRRQSILLATFLKDYGYHTHRVPQ